MINQISSILNNSGLKKTVQRTAVLEAILSLKNHPTAEKIIHYVQAKYPAIAVGTCYKTLDAFVEAGIIRKVRSENGLMRYDAITENHHHLYCLESDRIEDYNDEEVSAMLMKYFQKKKIRNFQIQNIRLEITGRFKTKPKNK